MSQTLRALVLKKEPSGESFLKLHLLSAESGIQLALKRISTKNSPTKLTPDLFDTADLQLDPSKQGTAYFVGDYQVAQRRSEIGKSYRSLRHAANFSNLLITNGTHVADPPALYQLTTRCMDAFAERNVPEVVFLKSVYLLLKEEGYAVRESWWPEVPVRLRDPVKTLLEAPSPDEQNREEQDRTEEAILHLLHWLRRETDLILPEGLG